MLNFASSCRWTLCGWNEKDLIVFRNVSEAGGGRGGGQSGCQDVIVLGNVSKRVAASEGA